MEKSKTKALCSHRMLDFLCFVLPPRCLSRIKARLARSFANNQHSRKQSGTTMLFLQQCVSLCEAWSRYAWLAGWLALIYIYKAHSCIPLPLSTPQPSQIPQTPIFPPQPPISPPQKKKKEMGCVPSRPLPSQNPYPYPYSAARCRPSSSRRKRPYEYEYDEKMRAEEVRRAVRYRAVEEKKREFRRQYDERMRMKGREGGRW